MHLKKVPHLHSIFLDSIMDCVMENVSVYVQALTQVAETLDP